MLEKFYRDTSGAIAVLASASLILLLFAVGGAIDGARWKRATSLHSQAIDSALLAGARAMQIASGDEAAALATAQSTYDANLLNRNDIKNSGVTFEIVDNGAAITYTGSATIDTTLLHLAGISSLPVSAPAKATFSRSLAGGSNMELAMILDVTGSMCDDGTGPCSSSTKLNALKEAATELTNIVFDTSSQSYTTHLALVPFARSIRVAPDGGGASLMASLTGMPATSSYSYTQCTAQGDNIVNGEIVSGGTCTATTTVHATDYKINPCVTERPIGSSIDPSDAAPGTGTWLNAQNGARNLDTGWNYTSTGRCETAVGNEFLPLTDRKDDVLARIGTLRARGPTAGALGLVFGQYVLSPKWNHIWPSSHAAGSYADVAAFQGNGQRLLKKIAVLMSDGSFNTYRAWQNRSQADISNDAIAVCNNMKANGIKIYTVAYDVDSLPQAEADLVRSTLQACGDDLTHFYEAQNTEGLKAAFRDIGVKTTPLRLSQ